MQNKWYFKTKNQEILFANADAEPALRWTRSQQFPSSLLNSTETEECQMLVVSFKRANDIEREGGRVSEVASNVVKEGLWTMALELKCPESLQRASLPMPAGILSPILHVE